MEYNKNEENLSLNFDDIERKTNALISIAKYASFLEYLEIETAGQHQIYRRAAIYFNDEEVLGSMASFLYNHLTWIRELSAIVEQKYIDVLTSP